MNVVRNIWLQSTNKKHLKSEEKINYLRSKKFEKSIWSFDETEEKKVRYGFRRRIKKMRRRRRICIQIWRSFSILKEKKIVTIMVNHFAYDDILNDFVMNKALLIQQILALCRFSCALRNMHGRTVPRTFNWTKSYIEDVN